MKILHILDHSLPLHSGYTFRSQNIFNAQRSRGWDPVVLTSPKHEQSWKGKWRPEEKIRNIKYYRTGSISDCRFPIEPEIRIMIKLARRIREIAEKEKPDIIHAHSPVLNAVPAIFAGRRLKIPVVYEIRAFWEDAAVDHQTYAENSWKYRLTQSIETWVCKNVSHVAVLCNGLKKDLIKRNIPEKKITCVFNGINPEDFRPCGPDRQLITKWGLKDKIIIGFIGSFYRYEGLDLLVKAFSQIAPRHPHARLLLVGGGEMEKELKSQTGALGISDKVIMPGRIPHEKIPGVYAMVDILAYPRYSMRLTELVTPLKPLEAMAMGKVLVASDVGGHKELIRHNETGILFKAGNAAALCESLEKLITNKSLCRKISIAGMNHVIKMHTWEKTTGVYQAIYGSLL